MRTPRVSARPSPASSTSCRPWILWFGSAESQANRDARVRFRYDWLRQDLERVRLGIQEHINAPRAQPRSFPPLRGDYRR